MRPRRGRTAVKDPCRGAVPSREHGTRKDPSVGIALILSAIGPAHPCRTAPGSARVISAGHILLLEYDPNTRTLAERQRAAVLYRRWLRMSDLGYE
jgi:hypothetical protein